jgi:ATP adenylyltransferase
MVVCSFCSEINGNVEHSLFDEVLKMHGIDKESFPTRFLFKDDDFIVLPMIGQMVEGYLLIIPVDHYMSYSHLQPRLYCKLQRLKSEVSKILELTYGAPIFFEHGPMSESTRAGSCCDHAHIHAVPMNVDVSDEFVKSGFDLQIIQSLSDLKSQYERKQPYLYYENQEGRAIVMDAPSVPSQFIRQLIAKKLNWGDKWNWMLHLNVEFLISTVHNLKPHFDQIGEL